MPSSAEVPVLSTAEVPVLSTAEVPVLSTAEVPVLSTAEVPVLSTAEVMRTALLLLIALLVGCTSPSSTVVTRLPATQTQERRTESGWFCHRELGEIEWVCEEDTSARAEH